MQNLQQLVEEHVTALSNGDIDAIMSHYHADAVLMHLQGVAQGYEEIKALFDFYVTSVLIPGKSEFKLQSAVTHDNLGVIIWSADTPTFDIPFATDTFIYDKNGLIAQQTTAGIMNPKT